MTITTRSLRVAGVAMLISAATTASLVPAYAETFQSREERRQKDIRENAAIAAALLGGYLLFKWLDSPSSPGQSTTRLSSPPVSADAANTGGPYRVVAVPANELTNVFSGPSSSHQLVTQLPYNAAGITIVGRCVNNACPIALNSQFNGGIGWINGNDIGDD